MGRYGSAILTIAGTIAGAYFGGAIGASLGSLAGSLAGSVLFPTKLPTQVGPRLTDTSQTTSSVGTPIPRGWGTFPSAGCIIAKTDLLEVDEKTTTGGKGGAPSQTVDTPTYYQTFAIGINDGLIAGIRVMWANGKPIYDRRPQGQTDTAGPTESDSAYKARMAANAQLESQFTLYLGSEDQMPDPTLEAFYGVGKISAFRGLAYIVFDSWKNKAEDGMRMPASWKFEVYETGSNTDSDGSSYSNEIVLPWNTGSSPPIDSRGKYSIQVKFIDQALPGHFTFDYSQVWDNVQEAYDAGVAVYIGIPGVYQGTAVAFDNSLNFNTDAVVERDGFPAGVLIAHNSPSDSYRAQFAWNYENPTRGYFDNHDATHQGDPNSDPTSYYGLPGTSWHRSLMLSKTTTHPQDAPFPGFPTPPWSGGTAWTNFFYALQSQDLVLEAERLPQPPLDPCIEGVPVPGLDGWVILDGQLLACGPYTLVDTPDTDNLVLMAYIRRFAQLDSERAVYYPLNPVVPNGDPRYHDEQFWTDAYTAAVARGDLPDGMVYFDGGVEIGSFTGGFYPLRQRYYYKSALTLRSVDTGFATVSDIVHDLCIEAGLLDADIDTSDIADLSVVGYVRTGVMAARDAITQLCQACFFDTVESNGKIAFRRRGKAIVATLSVDDLGAQAADDDSNAQTRLTSTDSQDVDLPRSIRVHYLSQSRDYEPGQQASPSRVDTKAVNDVDVNLSIVLLDTQALQIAQSIWATSWSERVAYQTTLDMSFLALEPTDSIAVPADGETTRVRITDITDALPSTRSLSLVHDDSAAYTSYAVADDVPNRQPPVLTVVVPAQSIFMDLPALRDVDDNAGFYIGMYGLLPDFFKTAALYRSVDNGGNYNRLVASSVQATTGTVTQAVAIGPTDCFDMGTEILVELYDVGDILDNATREDLLLGVNTAAIGADDRWEIVQFMSVQHIVGSIYKLTGLLRGRRGTEWAVGLSRGSVGGDRFVLLTTSIRVPMDVTLLNKDELYKTVGSGSTLDAAATQTFQGNGVALRPFSPVFINATKDSMTNDFTITWIRRSRIGQTLQSGVDVALHEAFEDYEVDILNTDGSVVRTLSSSVQNVAYRGLDQIVDFGAHITTLNCVVYQISEVVGRGYGQSATLVPTV